jgi:hypothetical protein
MNAHPIAANEFPYFQRPTGRTLRKVMRYEMVNGISRPVWEFEEIEVVWFCSEFHRLCHSCHKPMQSPVLAGKERFWRDNYYHLECVSVKQKKQIIRVLLEVRMKRKTRKNPTGIRTVEFIGLRRRFNPYLWQLTHAGYEVISRRGENNQTQMEINHEQLSTPQSSHPRPARPE